MLRDVHDPSYDPSYFVRDFPGDKQLQQALKAAQELSNSIAPILPGETPLDAERRIDQAFHYLRVEIDNNLDQFHRGERQGRKDQFIEEREKEIRTTYQAGIDNARRDDLKVGGQQAQEEEIQRFRKNIDSNEDLKKVMLDLSNKQAVRSEAISHAIKYTPPSLNRQEQQPPKPPTPSDEPPVAAPKYAPFKGESEPQFAARLERMEARDQREQQPGKEAPDLEIHRRRSGPTFGR